MNEIDFPTQKISEFIKRRIVQLIARFILGGVFVYASIEKIASPGRFVNIIIDYHILPEKLAIYLGFILPWLELILGIFLIVGIFVRGSSTALSFMLVVFLAAIVVKSLNGTINTCGCFSMSQTGSDHGLTFTIARDVFLLSLGLLIFFNQAKIVLSRN